MDSHGKVDNLCLKEEQDVGFYVVRCARKPGRRVREAQGIS
jgi:hypothetical protein